MVSLIFLILSQIFLGPVGGGGVWSFSGAFGLSHPRLSLLSEALIFFLPGPLKSPHFSAAHSPGVTLALILLPVWPVHFTGLTAVGCAVLNHPSLVLSPQQAD